MDTRVNISFRSPLDERALEIAPRATMKLPLSFAFVVVLIQSPFVPQTPEQEQKKAWLRLFGPNSVLLSRACLCGCLRPLIRRQIDTGAPITPPATHRHLAVYSTGHEPREPQSA